MPYSFRYMRAHFHHVSLAYPALHIVPTPAASLQCSKTVLPPQRFLPLLTHRVWLFLEASLDTPAEPFTVLPSCRYVIGVARSPGYGLSSRVVGPSCPVVHSPRFVVYPLWRGVVSKSRSRPHTISLRRPEWDLWFASSVARLNQAGARISRLRCRLVHLRKWPTQCAWGRPSTLFCAARCPTYRFWPSRMSRGRWDAAACR